MERSISEHRASEIDLLTSLLLIHDGHRFFCMAERGKRSLTWIVRMDGRTLRFVRTKRALTADEIRSLAIAVYDDARTQGLVG